MDSFDLRQHYERFYSEEQTSAIAALKTLIEFLNKDRSNTAIELTKNIRHAIEELKKIDCRIEVESVAEIYFRFITLSSSKFDEFNALKGELTRRSEVYLRKVLENRLRLPVIAQNFITDDSIILIHSYSRAVYYTLKAAMKKNKRFTVYVTESGPDYNGNEMFEKLKQEGCDVTLILDSAMGYIMERVDLVLVGAEGVTESGGIINKIGTYQLAICAKAHNKAFYAVTESYKFIRRYPLSQCDIPEHLRWRKKSDNDVISHASHSMVDYTPPNYITLLLTDLGPLTTAAVCDMLVQLYT
ncbi:Translation initiation factor eIF-2B subunit alpha [Sarcoptes scabiei]|uniref:Translation initiation factor eIF2B subunit alpha n=1 Tax=Sarcoptes scabiei TaxID=52283 RepID=A0A834VCS6_SARSC|nr:Translation initiation factor eIF-2B subunit alpha [Sarcoptes scabiei]UXI20845.1 chitinase [Sarcoptes scabiei]